MRRDQLTYDLGQPGGSSVPWKPVLLLVAVIALAGLLVGWVVASARTAPVTPAAGTVATATPTVEATAVPTGSPSAPTAGPVPSGSDAGEGLAVPEGSQRAATVFVRAWLDREAATRKPALEQVATPALAEQLMLTDPANIPRARPQGAPVLDEASTYSTQFTQALSTGMTIQVYLVADPGGRYGWVATSVDQA